MKYSFMSFSCPELTLEEILKLAEELGYDAVEPRIGSGHAHGIEWDTPIEKRLEIKRTVAAGNIPLSCLATSCRYADPEACPTAVQDTLKSIDLAADVGCHRIRVFGGKIGEGLSRGEAIDLVADSLSKVAERAAERGVFVCMETHDDWCDPKHVAAVLEKAGHHNIVANWDIMHPVRTGHATIDESFETLKPWIKHLHIHDGVTEDGKLRMVPIGEGQIDHRQALKRLLEIGYNGYISGEWINWEPYEVHLPRELAIMKEYEAELT